MSLLLVYTCVIGWSLGMLLRRTIAGPPSATSATPVTATQRHGDHVSLPMGLEDDPARWPPDRGDWTELDERQLLRLLTDSASRPHE